MQATARVSERISQRSNEPLTFIPSISSCLYRRAFTNASRLEDGLYKRERHSGCSEGHSTQVEEGRALCCPRRVVLPDVQK